jgi:hypothetical protein
MQNTKEFFAQYLEFNKKTLESSSEAKEIFDNIRNGERRYAKVHRTEDTTRDISWVQHIEDGVQHLQKIVDNPKSFIKTVEYLVPAELAKKTGPESVEHLATHSQYVKSIDKDGFVIPSKILTTEGDIDVQIYENRFVMTLIKRLHLYIEKRYIYLKHFASLQDMDIFYLDDTYKVGDLTVKMKSEVTFSSPAQSSHSIQEQVEASLEKVEVIRKYVNGFLGSNFMKVDMKNGRPVIPPIMQTNMLRKNPDYHAAYELWTFLNSEEHASMDFIVNEEIKGLTDDEQERIDFLNYLTVMDAMTGAEMKPIRLTKNEYASTVIPSIDDLLFLNDKFMPYELIRADEQYYEDAKAPLIQTIENKPKPVINKVFVQEKRRIADLQREERAALALKKRKEAEGKKLQRAQEAQRLAEEKEEQEREKAQQKEDEMQRIAELEILRKQVRDAALAYKKAMNGEVSVPVEDEEDAEPGKPIPTEEVNPSAEIEKEVREEDEKELSQEQSPISEKPDEESSLPEEKKEPKKRERHEFVNTPRTWDVKIRTKKIWNPDGTYKIIRLAPRHHKDDIKEDEKPEEARLASGSSETENVNPASSAETVSPQTEEKKNQDEEVKEESSSQIALTPKERKKRERHEAVNIPRTWDVKIRTKKIWNPDGTYKIIRLKPKAVKNKPAEEEKAPSEEKKPLEPFKGEEEKEVSESADNEAKAPKERKKRERHEVVNIPRTWAVKKRKKKIWNPDGTWKIINK